MKNNAKKYTLTAAIFVAVALLVELAILITTKVVKWNKPESGRPWVVAAHVHLLVLGAFWHLILALFEKNFGISENRLSQCSFVLYLLGLSLTVLMILYNGFAQLCAFKTVTALSEGGAALSHTVLFSGIALWMIVMIRSVGRSEK